VHTPFGIWNGNDTVCEVFAGNVNGGLVNISDFVLLQEFGDKGPVSENLTTTVCAVLAQDITFPVTVIFPPKGTVDGDTLISTPQTTCSVSDEEELPLKFTSPP